MNSEQEISKEKVDHNFESQPESQEGEKPQLSSAEVLSDTRQEISNTEATRDDTKQKLSEVRAELGLEPSNTIDHSVQSSEERLNELQARERVLAKGDSESERTMEMNQEIIKKIKASHWGEAMGRFQSTYNERLENNLTPLAYPEAMNVLGSKLRDMGEVLDDPKTDLKALTDKFKEVSAAMVDTYDVPPSSMVAEDEESLQRTYYAMNDLIEHQNELGLFIGNLDKSPNREDTEDLRNTLNSSTTVMERKRDWVGQRYQKLQEYNRGY